MGSEEVHDEPGAARDPWPAQFPLETGDRVARGLTVWSLPVDVDGFSGKVEGRTTGGRRACAAPTCGGWFIGVKWETGQQMFLCSRGWEYDPATATVHMTAGSGLSTTVATDRPNVRSDPPPRDRWPQRNALGPAWHVAS
jgi:hypothetical protein